MVLLILNISKGFLGIVEYKYQVKDAADGG